MENEENIPTFKCLLLGSGETGKTALIHRLKTGKFLKKYSATLGAKIHSVIFETNKGPIRFSIWDTAGQKKYEGLQDVYYHQSHCAIIMFSMISDISYNSLSYWNQDLIRVCKKILTIVCGNKFDISHRPIKRNTILLDKQTNVKYFNISVKENLNLEQPFLWFAKKLTGDKTLEFIKNSSLASEVKIEKN